MLLTLKREPSDARCTLGKLYVDGAYQCETLEDVIRPEKIKGCTCIPAGRYEVVINWSNRFGRMLPLLLNVPGFDGIRIHPGNTDADTEGCILVGRARAQDSILHSRDAFDALFPKLDDACRRGKVFIEIVNPA